jgi:hypothetical protein
MVRRWSCLINITNNFSNNSFFFFKHKINLFKTSVNFKRFTFKLTKFKRKAFIRLKHRSNFLLYTNVLKFWIKDYLFNKHYIKYQYFNKIFINNFFFYNFNFIKNRNENFFYNFNFYFSILTNKTRFYFYNRPSFYSNTPLFLAWFLNNPSINNSVIPVYNQWDNSYFTYKIPSTLDSFFNFNIVFNNLFDIFLKKNIEIRKIFILLFYFKILKS